MARQPMRLTRGRVPGMPRAAGDDLAADPGPTQADELEPETDIQRQRASVPATGRRGRGRDGDSARSSRPATGAGLQANPYAGEGSVALNARLPVSLHNRYKHLARELTASGYRTTANDLYLALLHYGPTTIEEARDLTARFRADKAQYRREPTRPTATRVYSSVHRRYQQLAWALDDAGVDNATMTELLLALLHLGPTDPEAGRELARRWRTLLAG